MQFDWKRLSTLDRVIAGGGLVAFIALFLPWWGVGVIDYSVSAWSAGFTAWAGGLLLTAAGVLVVLRRSGANMSFGQVGPSVVIAAVAALGLLLVIIRWISLPRYDVVGTSYGVGAKYGLYLALIAGIAEVTAAVMQMRGSGEQVPSTEGEHQPEPTEPEPEPETPAAPKE
jgi:hypothetical protein